MLALSAVLLVAVVGGELAGPVAVPVHVTAPRPAEEEQAAETENSVVWTAEQVRQWAAKSSTGASLIDVERRSVGAGLDRKENGAAAQVGLVQSVLRHVAAHERNRAAGEALELYHQLVGIEAQQELAAEAEQVIESLLTMAERAEALELPDGDTSELRGRLLEIRDQSVQLEYGGRAARRRLARLTGQPLSAVEAAELGDALPRELAVESTAGALETAFRTRGDLRAADALCQCLNQDSLPAARAMMSVLRPGLGLALAGRSTLLSRLRSGQGNASELNCRRQQCRQLQESIRESITDEIEAAELALWEADQRVALAIEREELAISVATKTESAVELDQASPGSERLALLDALQLAGETMQRRVELAHADVQLRQAQGTLSE